MKSKISIPVDEEMVRLIEQAVQEGKFRNRSHMVEYALKTMMRDEK